MSRPAKVVDVDHAGRQQRRIRALQPRRLHYLTVLALAVYGIDRERALVHAIVLYAVALPPKIALGVLIMAVGPHGFSFGAVHDLARRGKAT